MSKMIIFLILMVIVFLGWIIANIRYMKKRITDILKNEDFYLQVKCEKCGKEYEVHVSELQNSWFSKSRSVTRTKLNGPIIENRPTVSYIAKKFFCTECNKRRFAEILNYDEVIRRYRPIITKVGITQIVIMVIGGFVIKTILEIIHKIVF